MLGHEFMRNALLAGTFVALACGALGWFVVLRGQLFAGDALGHVAFPGALAAAAAGVDQRAGLFAATLVRSYRTISPLPARRSRGTADVGGLFLWHFPAGFPGSIPRPPCPLMSGLSSKTLRALA